MKKPKSASRRTSKNDYVPPSSTAFPASWTTRKMTINDVSFQAAKAPDGRLVGSWFLSRETAPQDCEFVEHWATQISLAYLAVIRHKHGEHFARIAQCLAKNGDLIMVPITSDKVSADDVYCAVIPASEVPVPCHGCQMIAAKALVNVRDPASTTLGTSSKTQALVN